MHTDWSFTLWWQNVRFEGYWREALARRETQERHTGMESKGESRRISFHVWLACTYCFPAGRFAWALGRQGVFCFSSFFLFLLLHITHTHGSHTPGAQTLPKAGGIRECICIFLKKKYLDIWQRHEGNVAAASLALRNVHSPTRSAGENETFLRMRTDMASGRGGGRQTTQRTAAPQRQGATPTRRATPAYCGLLG